MSSPEKITKSAPLKKIAEASFEKPGMYLIKLRAHLNKGKAVIGDVFDSVTHAFPKAAKAQSPEQF